MSITGFRCPQCGSEYFITIDLPEGELWTRQCRGQLILHTQPVRGREYTGCTFTWKSNHDARYGLSNDRDHQE